MIVDTHAHLMVDQFKGEVGELVKRASDAGVTKILNIGMDVESSKAAVDMASEFEGCYATLGFHPYYADQLTEDVIESWKKLIAENEKIVAIGECGLDFSKTDMDRGVQEKSFRAQVELAKETGVPLVVHSRGAERECLDILREYDVVSVFHCYGGDIELAREIWDSGFYTSFTGIVTYKNAQDLVEVAKEVPMDKFLVETDCPYLAPQKYRGKRNEPAYVVEVVSKIAELKGVDFSEIADISTRNAEEFFSRLK